MCDADGTLPKGAESVGWFDDAPPLSRLFIWVLRRWMEGACGQQAVWNHFAEKLGPVEGHRAMGAFEDLIRILAARHLRVLHRHQASCSCVGADEQVLARMVTSAGAGQMTVALADATVLVEPSGTSDVLYAAAVLGRVLAQVGDAPKPVVTAATAAASTAVEMDRTLH